MRIKQDYLNVGLVLTALALLPLAHPAMAEEEVPFKGVEVGTLSAASFDFPFATILNVAEGEATQFGHYTVTGIVVVNVLSSTATGTFTMTAANGDMLFITMTGVALQPPSLKETLDNVTVTGGTGRFEGATGSWVNDSHFAFLFGDVSTDPYIAVLEGTISTPGANKK
jgi:hypothetical protein